MTATPAATPTAPLVEVRDLYKHFPVRGGLLSRRTGAVHAVDGVSFTLQRGECMGLVGESGSGKTTVGRLMMRLLEPTGGQVLFEGRDVARADGEELRALRRQMQMIFQDPYSSLNPRMTVEQMVREPLAIHRLAQGSERARRVAELLDVVGLSAEHARRYPHEFSGGQRQRIGIARALAVNPKLLVCDEPVSALDVSIQAQVINLLRALQREFRLTYLFIAHDLGVVRHIADRVAVMYLGKVVEMAAKPALFARPLHPYTQALFSAIPIPDPEAARERIILQGDVPTPIDPPSGCRFHTRCPFAEEACRQREPPLTEVAPGHQAACHLVTPERLAANDVPTPSAAARAATSVSAPKPSPAEDGTRRPAPLSAHPHLPASESVGPPAGAADPTDF